MNYRNRLRIGVIGGASAKKLFLDQAFQIGKLIAQNKAILVCGGLGGVMEKAAMGAKSEGGLTIGILPGNAPKDANSFIDIPIATGLGYTRNSLVVMNSDVLIAIDGQYGTLCEIAYSIIYGKKIIGLGTWDIKGVLKANSPEDAVELALYHFGKVSPVLKNINGQKD